MFSKGKLKSVKKILMRMKPGSFPFHQCQLIYKAIQYFFLTLVSYLRDSKELLHLGNAKQSCTLYEQYYVKQYLKQIDGLDRESYFQLQQYNAFWGTYQQYKHALIFNAMHPIF